MLALLALSVIGAAAACSDAKSDGNAVRDLPWVVYQTIGADGVESVGLVRIDGSRDHLIATDLAGAHVLPDWAPDSQHVVFASRGGATEPLYVHDITSGMSTQLFACEDPCLGDDEPAYSPDGTEVAFVRAFGPFANDAPSDCGVWIGNIATGDVRQVTSQPGCDPRATSPRWSPDGTGLEPLTDYDDADTRATQPRYSPDGSSVVFTLVTNSSRTLALIPADGGATTPITDSGIRTHASIQPAVTTVSATPAGDALRARANLPDYR